MFFARCTNQSALALAVSLTLFTGCGSSTAEPSTESEATTLPATQVSLAPVDKPAPMDSPSESNRSEYGHDTAAAPAADEKVFVPPFPRRTDLFARPDASKAAGIVRKRIEERTGNVTLKGFVEVDQPRAMLHIDGQLWLAAVGEKRDNVKVVSITPPSVAILRDNNPINLSLHDDG